METTPAVDRPPRPFQIISAILGLAAIVFIVWMLICVRGIDKNLALLVDTDLSRNEELVRALNENEALHRTSIEKMGTQISGSLNNVAGKFGDGLKVIGDSVASNRETINKAIDTVRDLATSKVDSMIISEHTTTEAVTNGFSQLNKQVADLKAALIKDAEAKAAVVETPPQPPSSRVPSDSPPAAPTASIENMIETQRSSLKDACPVPARTVSSRFKPEDIIADKVKLSKAAGVFMRKYVRGWGKGWIDIPLPTDGTYDPHELDDASKVSFYSLTDNFEIRLYK